MGTKAQARRCLLGSQLAPPKSPGDGEFAAIFDGAVAEQVDGQADDEGPEDQELHDHDASLCGTEDAEGVAEQGGDRGRQREVGEDLHDEGARVRDDHAECVKGMNIMATSGPKMDPASLAVGMIAPMAASTPVNTVNPPTSSSVPVIIGPGSKTREDRFISGRARESRKNR